MVGDDFFTLNDEVEPRKPAAATPKVAPQDDVAKALMSKYGVSIPGASATPAVTMQELIKLATDTSQKLNPGKAITPEEVVKTFDLMKPIINEMFKGVGGGGYTPVDVDKIVNKFKTETEATTKAARDQITKSMQDLEARRTNMEQAPAESQGNQVVKALSSLAANLSMAAAGMTGSSTMMESAKAARDAADATNSATAIEALMKGQIPNTPIGLSSAAQKQFSETTLKEKARKDSQNLDIDKLLATMGLQLTDLDLNTARKIADLTASIEVENAKGKASAAHAASGAAAAKASALGGVLQLLLNKAYDKDPNAGPVAASIFSALASHDSKDNKIEQDINNNIQKMLTGGASEAEIATYLELLGPIGASYLNRLKLSAGQKVAGGK